MNDLEERFAHFLEVYPPESLQARDIATQLRLFLAHVGFSEGQPAYIRKTPAADPEDVVKYVDQAMLERIGERRARGRALEAAAIHFKRSVGRISKLYAAGLSRRQRHAESLP